MQSTIRSGSCRCSASQAVVTSISGRSAGAGAAWAKSADVVNITMPDSVIVRKSMILPFSAQRLACHHGQHVHVAPFVDRAIKHSGVISQIFGDEIVVRGLQANLAIGNQFLSGSNAARS